MAEPNQQPVALPGFWQQIFAAQRRETRRVLSEMIVAREMMPLLMKVRNGGHWTRAEKEVLLEQLRRLARLSPYLVVLLLPGSIFILPAYAWWLDRRRLNRGCGKKSDV